MSLLAAVLLIVRLIDGAGLVVETRTLYDPSLTPQRCEARAHEAHDSQTRRGVHVLAVCQEWEPVGAAQETET